MYQFIMVFTLSVHYIICQLYLNKAAKKKIKKWDARSKKDIYSNNENKKESIFFKCVCKTHKPNQISYAMSNFRSVIINSCFFFFAWKRQQFIIREILIKI